MREALCSNQVAMWIASCQNNVQVNDCNTETLEWSSVCTQGTTKAFNHWQYPIPFKLCRIDLLACLQSCPNLDPMYESSVPNQQSRLAVVQTPQPQGEDDNINVVNDMDQDDYDAIQEARLLRQNDPLEESSYSRFEVEAYREQIAIKKKKLHKQLWAAQQRQQQRNEAIGSGSHHNSVSHNNDRSDGSA
ncbi:hypothetical protein BGX33_012176 [Mortierella sp. NVP41]|nr:hypothetical protein BGX33_012176 [Mortierella sp. NVP41]